MAATVTPTFSTGKGPGGTRHFLITWTGIVTGDTCLDAEVPGVLDTIHILGTFNGGTSVAIAGTNQPITAITARVSMKDVDGTTIAALAAALVVPRENPLCIRPQVASGSSDSITVIARCRI